MRLGGTKKSCHKEYGLGDSEDVFILLIQPLSAGPRSYLGTIVKPRNNRLVTVIEMRSLTTALLCFGLICGKLCWTLGEKPDVKGKDQKETPDKTKKTEKDTTQNNEKQPEDNSTSDAGEDHEEAEEEGVEEDEEEGSDLPDPFDLGWWKTILLPWWNRIHEGEKKKKKKKKLKKKGKKTKETKKKKKVVEGEDAEDDVEEDEEGEEEVESGFIPEEIKYIGRVCWLGVKIIFGMIMG